MTASKERARASIVRRLVSLVQLEHTLFALPFAYAGALLAYRSTNLFPGWRELLWITLAMVGARSLAMGINRLIDREIDARNPRTVGRELPSGGLTPQQVIVFCLASLALLVLATFRLAPIVRYLWPIPVTAFVVYPYLKRATWLCHFWLGTTIGLAPLAAWLAVGRPVALAPLALWIAVACWVAGFDLLYGLFDLEVDREQGLHSFAVSFGVPATFWAARTLHLVTVAALAVAGIAGEAGFVWGLGVAAVAALLLYEHLIVSPNDLRRLNAAFFTTNGVIAVVFFAFALIDSLV
ncbi:MAG: UbiA-like polyprenyltransferase [Gaiellaceae bacterium]|jgi:4-hydroxybenzoate polyprenyltransferase